MALSGRTWSYAASYGLDVAFHGHDYVLASLELAWPFMALNGILWSFMAEYRLLSRS